MRSTTTTTTPAPLANCPEGYGVLNNMCTACQIGYYKPDVGRHACTQCPLDRFNTRSKTDTIASTQCYFVSGIYRKLYIHIKQIQQHIHKKQTPRSKSPSHKSCHNTGFSNI